jgi:hypothetical protein
MKSREKKLETTIKAEEKKASEFERNIEHSTEDIEKYEKELANLDKSLKKEEADLEAVSSLPSLSSPPPSFSFVCLRTYCKFRKSSTLIVFETNIGTGVRWSQRSYSGIKRQAC